MLKLIYLNLKDKATGMVPVNKQSHLRPLATINQINKCMSISKSKPKSKDQCGVEEHKNMSQKFHLVKYMNWLKSSDLNKGDDLMIDQSYSERQLEKAYERLLSEFNIVLDISLEETQKKLDKALKRNLEAQKQKLKKTDNQTGNMEPEVIEEGSIETEPMSKKNASTHSP